VKVLLDTCVSGYVTSELQAAGHDVVWSGDWLQDPGDDTILETAQRGGRVLVTLDKDLGELAILRGHSTAESSGL
jgi:predicted nuclease of predicted toxin-antitoxin system